MDPQRRGEQDEVIAQREARCAAKLDELLSVFWDDAVAARAGRESEHPAIGSPWTFLEREFGAAFLEPRLAV